MAERMTNDELLEGAYAALDRHPGGLTMKAWEYEAELTRSQLRRAIDAGRDIFDMDEADLFVRVRVGSDWIYKIAVAEEDWREYLERRLRGQITRGRRDYHEAHKANQRHPSIENERQEESARRILVDLRYRYSLLYGQPPLNGSEGA